MMINTNVLIPMTDANQNFSKVVRLVDEQGTAVILKNNKPRYAVIDFSEYDSFLEYRKNMIEKTVSFDWRKSGSVSGVSKMINLTIDEIIYLYEKLIQKTGGMSGIRDLGMLESAVYSAMQSFDEEV